MPPDGQNVIVTLSDGSELLAYFHAENWWVGQPDNPEDIMLEGVVSWREVV
jgi:hypothetical protein